MKTYIVQTAGGALAGHDNSLWRNMDWNPTLEQAREAMAFTFGGFRDSEDRGEEFEREWERCIERAKVAEVCEVVSFDEFAARIIEEESED